MPTQKTITMTTGQYAKERGKERTTVFKAAQKNRFDLLPGVIDIKKSGTTYLLEVKPSALSPLSGN